MATMPRSAQGIHGGGSKDFTEQQRGLVLAELRRYQGPSRRVTVEDLARVTGVEGRTVRAVVNDLDGNELLVGEGNGDGWFCCDFADDGERFTRRLRAQARTMLERADRRDRFAAKLPRRQGGLFG